MKQSKGIKSLVLLALLVILVVQGGMMGWFGSQKVAYHVDEIYTFELANCPYTWFSHREGFLESWVDGEEIRNAITVDGLADLDYSIPYHNQENDVHPPLYYFVIHTISALFQGEVSKWVGILPNMFFCLLTTILLYLAGTKLWEKRGPALVAAGWWAWSVGCMSTAVFVRMYAMLTCLCTALVLMHLVALAEIRRGELRKRTLAGLFLLTLAGILTQYYFLVFCFFLCGICFLFLCVTKRWKQLVVYTVTEGLALCGAVVIFPKMLRHIFGGYRGKQAFESVAQGAGFFQGLNKVGGIISDQLCNGWLEGALLLAVLALAVGVVVRCRRGQKVALSHGDWTALYLLCVAAGYWGIITKVAPYQTDRYVFCIYPLVVLVLVYLGHRALGVFLRKPQVCTAVLALVGVAVTVLSYQSQSVNYLYTPYLQRYQALEAYEGYPIVYLSVNGTYQSRMDQFAMEFIQNDQVFCCKNGNWDGVKKAADTGNLQDGFLLYLLDEGDLTESEIREKLAQQVSIQRWEPVTEVGGLVYFCTLEEGATG